MHIIAQHASIAEMKLCQRQDTQETTTQLRWQRLLGNKYMMAETQKNNKSQHNHKPSDLLKEAQEDGQPTVTADVKRTIYWEKGYLKGK